MDNASLFLHAQHRAGIQGDCLCAWYVYCAGAILHSHEHVIRSGAKLAREANIASILS